jgi:hypothetical protein
VSTGIKRTLSVGMLLLLAGAVIAVATWPHNETDALGGTDPRESAVPADLGLAAAMLGLLLVVLVGIAYVGSRLESRNQWNKP